MRKTLISLMMILSLVSKSQIPVYLDTNLVLNTQIVGCQSGDVINFSNLSNLPFYLLINDSVIASVSLGQMVSYTFNGTDSTFKYVNQSVPFGHTIIGHFQLLVNTPQYISKKLPFTISNNTINIVGDRLVVTNVFSLDGKLVISDIIKTGSIGIDNLSHGIYILDIDQIKYKFIK